MHLNFSTKAGTWGVRMAGRYLGLKAPWCRPMFYERSSQSSAKVKPIGNTGWRFVLLSV